MNDEFDTRTEAEPPGPGIDALSATEQALVEGSETWVDDHAEALVDLLSEIVACESITGQEGTHKNKNSAVGRLYAYQDDAARGTDIEISTQPISSEYDYIEPQRENIYAVLPGRDSGGLITTSHTDIVPTGGTTGWPGDDPLSISEGRVHWQGGTTIEIETDDQTFEREIRSEMARVWESRENESADVLIGRGAYDNKASSVCIAGAVTALGVATDSIGAQLGGDLITAHLVDEEVYQLGVKEFVGWRGANNWLGDRYRDRTQSLDGFAAVVLEGSYGFVPVVGHRGLIWAELEASGAAVHASTPDIGRNAVVGLAKAVAAADDPDEHGQLAALFAPDDLLGSFTIASGTTIVSGGIDSINSDNHEVERSGLNAVPDWAEATFDLRIPRWEGYPEGVDILTEHVCDRLEATASTVAPAIDFRANIPDHGYFPPVALAPDHESARDHPLVKTACHVANETLGYKPGIEVAPGVTDAAFLAHGTDIPTLVEYGPAGGLSHETLEFVERDQLLAGTKAMIRLAVRYLGAEGQ